MPRLRYLKKYTPIEVNYEDANEREEEDLRNRERDPNELSGKSWLSNAAIVGAMSEAKIKQAISYYYEMAHLLEAELLARSVYPESRVIKNRSICNASNFQNASQSFNKNTRIVLQTRKGIFKGLRLSTELKEALLECLEELRT